MLTHVTGPFTNPQQVDVVVAKARGNSHRCPTWSRDALDLHREAGPSEGQQGEGEGPRAAPSTLAGSAYGEVGICSPVQLAPSALHPPQTAGLGPWPWSRSRVNWLFLPREGQRRPAKAGEKHQGSQEQPGEEHLSGREP